MILKKTLIVITFREGATSNFFCAGNCHPGGFCEEVLLYYLGKYSSLKISEVAKCESQWFIDVIENKTAYCAQYGGYWAQPYSCQYVASTEEECNTSDWCPNDTDCDV